MIRALKVASQALSRAMLENRALEIYEPVRQQIVTVRLEAKARGHR